MSKTIQTKEEIIQDFQVLLAEQKAAEHFIKTKEEAAVIAQNKKLVTTVAAYKPDLIVKGAADLRLTFTTSIETLGEQLQKELEKLEELRSAIQVESTNLKACNHVKIAADAFHILKKEQEQQLELFEKESAKKIESLQEEITKTQKDWEKEEIEFLAEIEERKKLLEKNRIKELEDYKYELERKYRIGEDDYKKQKKFLLRKLDEETQQKEKNWKSREKVLAENQKDFEKYKTKVDGFDKEKDEEVKKAKEKAIKEASRKAKVEMELHEKGVEGKRKMATLRIEELSSTIERQKDRITQLDAELKEALTQVKALSLKALEK